MHESPERQRTRTTSTSSIVGYCTVDINRLNKKTRPIIWFIDTDNSNYRFFRSVTAKNA